MYDFLSDMRTVKHFFNGLNRSYDIDPNLRHIKAETLMDADVHRAWDRLQTVKLDIDMGLMDTLDTEKTE